MLKKKKKITSIKCYPDMTGNPWNCPKFGKEQLTKHSKAKCWEYYCFKFVLNFECFSCIDNTKFVNAFHILTTKLLWSNMAKHLHMVSEKY